MRGILASLTIVTLTALTARGQQLVPQPNSPPLAPQQPAAPRNQQVQPGAPPLAPQQPLVAQVPPGFNLTPAQQAFLDNTLKAWELQSGKIATFSCPFQRWEYDPAFGPQIPGQKIPLNKNLGELSYQRPDKGSFQITKIKVFQMPPAKAGQQSQQAPQGDWIEQPNAIGEHWVCDGKSVFEYRHDQKQLVERPIPPQLQGKGIADGPLPFLFGAEADKLKAKYWLRIEEKNQDPNVIWVVALPRFQEQAADFSRIDVMLDRQQMLPTAMRVSMPNNSEHMYLFMLTEAKVNAAFARFGAMIFGRPRVPFGYKLVVEEAPLQQAAQPAAPAR